MLLFVAVCFIPLYRQVIVSFFASVKTGVSIQLVAIATFCFATQNTYVLRVFCAVQLECHTDDFAYFWWNCTKGDRNLFPVLVVSCFKSWSHPHDVKCALRCCATCFGTVLDKC